MEKVVTIGEADVGFGVVRIADDGLGEKVDGLIETFGRAFVPVVDSFEVKFLRLWVDLMRGGGAGCVRRRGGARGSPTLKNEGQASDGYENGEEQEELHSGIRLVRNGPGGPWGDCR